MGRALERKIKKAYGEGCTNVFDPICKLTKADHEQLKEKFANLFDSLPGDGVASEELVSQARAFMQMNNELMKSVKMGTKVNCALVVVAAIVIGLIAVVMMYLSHHVD